jgi:hypothetical protein
MQREMRADWRCVCFSHLCFSHFASRLIDQTAVPEADVAAKPIAAAAEDAKAAASAHCDKMETDGQVRASKLRSTRDRDA